MNFLSSSYVWSRVFHLFYANLRSEELGIPDKAVLRATPTQLFFTYQRAEA
jgi:hypothetical protein